MNAVWALPAIFILRAIRPLIRIQFCEIISWRIGQFISDISEHICREKIGNRRTLNLYYFGMISNSQWEKMAYRSNLKILGSWLKYLDRWNQLIPGGNAHTLKSSLTESRDTEGLFESHNGSIPFLEYENSLGEKFLKSKGWKVGEPYICLLVRDSKFMEAYSNSDWSYHDYRDSDIARYATSMEWLASQGVWVFRMGKLMARPFQTNSPRIIDYAFDSDKSDFLDIWLFANCTGVISTGTGPDQLAMIYRRPQLYLNAMPLGGLHSWTNMTWVPKNLKWQKTGVPLSISEYLDNNFFSALEYMDAGIEIVDLSIEEIEVAVQEFWSKINNSHKFTDNDVKLQENFWKIFIDWPLYGELHGVKHPNASIGRNWLANLSENSLR